MVQWLRRPRQLGFEPHSFLVLFHLIKVVRLTILVEEEGVQRVYVGFATLFWQTTETCSPQTFSVTTAIVAPTVAFCLNSLAD